jgi:hypothetical protein
MSFNSNILVSSESTPEPPRRRQRRNRYIPVHWLDRHYLLNREEYDLACVWIAMRGLSLAALPYGREVKCIDLSPRDWPTRAAAPKA